MSSDSGVDLRRFGVRSRAVSAALTSGVLMCGIFGGLGAAVAHEGPAIERTVGVTALLTLILAAAALVRRSWARLPLVVAGYCAGSLASDAFFVSERDPSEWSYLIGYLFLNAVIALSAAAALLIFLLGLVSAPRASRWE